MNRNARKIATLLAAFTLCGCPFESDKPMGGLEKASIDSRLLGTWVCRNLAEAEPETGRIQIFQFNEREYYVEIDEGKGLDDRLRAYARPLAGDASVLNVQRVAGESPRPYYVVSYRFEANGDLRFRILDDEARASLVSSSGDRARFIAEHLGTPGAPQPPMVDCTRPQPQG